MKNRLAKFSFAIFHTQQLGDVLFFLILMNAMRKYLSSDGGCSFALSSSYPGRRGTARC
jgi:hypothetical protein